MSPLPINMPEVNFVVTMSLGGFVATPWIAERKLWMSAQSASPSGARIDCGHYRDSKGKQSHARSWQAQASGGHMQVIHMFQTAPDILISIVGNIPNRDVDLDHCQES